MRVIKTQSIPKDVKKNASDDLLARFCFYFPQYKYHEARLLPVKRIKLMLRVVDVEKALMYHHLVQIVASPHSSKGKAVDKLLTNYEKIING